MRRRLGCPVCLQRGAPPPFHSGKVIPNSNTNDAFSSHLTEDDGDLRREADWIKEERTNSGLQGLVGGLQAVVINTEPHLQLAAANEQIRYSGLRLHEVFQDEEHRTYVLRLPGEHPFRSADFLIRSRRKGSNPFQEANDAPGLAACPTLVWRHLSLRHMTLKSTSPCKARPISNSREK